MASPKRKTPPFPDKPNGSRARSFPTGPGTLPETLANTASEGIAVNLPAFTLWLVVVALLGSFLLWDLFRALLFR